jgi:hypothetical protein
MADLERLADLEKILFCRRQPGRCIQSAKSGAEGAFRLGLDTGSHAKLQQGKSSLSPSAAADACHLDHAGHANIQRPGRR